MSLYSVVLWIALALVVGKIASGKGRRFHWWALIALAISPLLGGILLFLVGDAPSGSAYSTSQIQRPTSSISGRTGDSAPWPTYKRKTEAEIEKQKAADKTLGAGWGKLDDC